MARYHRVEDIIRLALLLQSPGPGLCLENVQERFGVGRRTAERMREAVDRLYPGMTSSKGLDGRKYWRLPPGEANGLVVWHPEELRALDEIIGEAQAAGAVDRAAVLTGLREKLAGLAPDASGDDTAAPDPRATALRDAIIEDRSVRLRLGPHAGEATVVHPHGVLGGGRPQLVAFRPDRGRAELVPVDSILAVEARPERFERQPALDLRRHAANALATLADGPVDVCWRFAADAADDVVAYEFAAGQEIELRDDGSVEVRFQADGLVAMGWHLFAWGDRVQMIRTPILKKRFDEMMQRALQDRMPRTETVPLGAARAPAPGEPR